jgi:hypothetical protein
MRKLGAFALATVLACALPASAQAVPIIDFNGTSGAFKNTSIAAGDFDDTYKFDVSDMGIVSGTITSIAVDFVTNIDFSSVMLNGVEFSNLISGETEFRRITNLPVSGGEQTLRVRGTSDGNGAYSGTLAFTAQAVPEPAGWTTMVLALGLLGTGLTISRRTREKGKLAEAA